MAFNLPPGVTHAMIDEAYGIDQPCEICGQDEDNCICPECSVCGSYGDPYCYVHHGLRRTEEQKFLREVMDREIQADIEAENKYWDQYQEYIKEENKFWEQYHNEMDY